MKKYILKSALLDIAVLAVAILACYVEIWIKWIQGNNLTTIGSFYELYYLVSNLSQFLLPILICVLFVALCRVSKEQKHLQGKLVRCNALVFFLGTTLLYLLGWYCFSPDIFGLHISFKLLLFGTALLISHLILSLLLPKTLRKE